MHKPYLTNHRDETNQTHKTPRNLIGWAAEVAETYSGKRMQDRHLLGGEDDEVALRLLEKEALLG